MSPFDRIPVETGRTAISEGGTSLTFAVAIVAKGESKLSLPTASMDDITY